MSFTNPYQKSTGKMVHRASRKQRYSATVGYLGRKPEKAPVVSERGAQQDNRGK